MCYSTKNCNFRFMCKFAYMKSCLALVMPSYDSQHISATHGEVSPCDDIWPKVIGNENCCLCFNMTEQFFPLLQNDKNSVTKKKRSKRRNKWNRCCWLKWQETQGKTRYKCGKTFWQKKYTTQNSQFHSMLWE